MIIFKPGTRVMIYGETEGVIISANIYQAGITYVVEWFHDGDLKSAYLHDYQFQVIDDDPLFRMILK